MYNLSIKECYFSIQTQMSVRMALTVVMRMQTVLTLMGAILVPVSLDTLEMETAVKVSYLLKNNHLTNVLQCI